MPCDICLPWAWKLPGVPAAAAYPDRGRYWLPRCTQSRLRAQCMMAWRGVQSKIRHQRVRTLGQQEGARRGSQEGREGPRVRCPVNSRETDSQWAPTLPASQGKGRSATRRAGRDAVRFGT